MHRNTDVVKVMIVLEAGTEVKGICNWACCILFPKRK